MTTEENALLMIQKAFINKFLLQLITALKKLYKLYYQKLRLQKNLTGNARKKNEQKMRHS